MKRFYSFVFAAVSILAAASCQKEMANEPIENNGEQYTFTATIEADTKTVLADGMKVNWSVDDNISVFDVEGKAVEFVGQHESQVASATFAATKYNPADNIYALYPHKSDATINSNGIIGILRVGGEQTAVAGSFDPTYAFIVGSESEPGILNFKNAHSLIKFTIGGERVPEKVILTNGGARNIAGQFRYNTSAKTESPIVQTDDEANVLPGAKTITLSPAVGASFEVGQTYYIAVIGGGNFANMTLEFDDTIVKTVEGAKYADTQNNHLIGKIIDFGTLAYPTQDDTPTISLSRVWDAAVPFGGGQDRNMTMDSEYVYVAQAAGGNGAIKAISIADPTQTKNVKVTTYTPAGLDNGTHAVSCVRMLPNTDPAVNGGKDVLVASNLTTGDGTEKLIVYVWSNGIDADPNYFVIDSGARRLGDKFTVKGTYQSGELHFFDFNDGNTVIRVNMKDGVAGLWGTPELAYATGRYAMPVAGASNIGECTIHPDTAFDGDGNPTAALLTTNAVNGFFTQNSGNAFVASAWGTDPGLTQTFGYNFFTYNDNDYIAYVKVAGDRNSATLNVIADINGASDFKGTLEAKAGLVTAPINGTGNAGHGLGDCATVEVDGVRYIAVMAQNIGITLYSVESAE